MDAEWLTKAIENNKNLDFVKRMIHPGDYPVINNPDGSVSTHKMSYASKGDKFIVYPTIVNKDGELIEMSSQDAMNYAVKNKQYIEFDDENKAELFSLGAWKNMDNMKSFIDKLK